jgi:pimeloyl-ACP methyl ester carboxylesterase
MGCAGIRRIEDPPQDFSLGDYADCLADFARGLHPGQVHVVGLSFGGGLAIELYRRHPRLLASLVLASAYAGWRGSLPNEEIERRLQQALQLSDLSGVELVDALMPTMFSNNAPAELVSEFSASVREFHPAGLRATARAFAEADLGDVLPTIAVPTLLLYGERDVRAPLDVARRIHAAVPRSKLVVIPDAGHIVNIEAAAQFNAEVRIFLRGGDWANKGEPGGGNIACGA